MDCNELSGGGTALGPPAVERRVDRRARIHDENITRAQKVGQVSCGRVPNAVCVSIGHEQTDAIAREAASLRWFARHELFGEHEVECVESSGRDVLPPVLRVSR
jgi:hypothetical protein